MFSSPNHARGGSSEQAPRVSTLGSRAVSLNGVGPHPPINRARSGALEMTSFDMPFRPPAPSIWRQFRPPISVCPPEILPPLGVNSGAAYFSDPPPLFWDAPLEFGRDPLDRRARDGAAALWGSLG